MREKLWTRSFIITSTIFFLSALVFYLLIVTIGTYTIGEFNASTSMAGLVSGIFIIGAFIGRLFSGRIIARTGSRVTLFYGLIAFIFTTLLYFGAANLPLLVANRLLHGAALGVTLNSTGTLIAEILPDSRKGEGIGYYSLGGILAAAVGPFIGILMVQKMEFSSIFYLNFGLSVICFLLFFFIRFPERAPSTEVEDVTRFKWTDYFEFRAIPISVVALLVGFSYSGIMAFLSIFAEEINLVEAASFFFFVYAVAVLLSRPFTGRIMDIKGPNIIVYPSLVLFAIGMVLFSQATNGFILLLAGVLIGLGYGNFNSIAQTIAIQVTPAHRLGLATSTYFVFFDFGLGIGPYILGLLVPYSGYRNIFLFMVAVIFTAFVLYYFLHGKKHSNLKKVKKVKTG